MAVEALDLGEEPHVERKAVEDADRVMRIGRGDEAIAGVLDRLQVTRRDVAGDAGDGEVLHVTLSLEWSPRRAVSPLPASGPTCSE